MVIGEVMRLCGPMGSRLWIGSWCGFAGLGRLVYRNWEFGFSSFSLSFFFGKMSRGEGLPNASIDDEAEMRVRLLLWLSF